MMGPGGASVIMPSSSNRVPYGDKGLARAPSVREKVSCREGGAARTVMTLMLLLCAGMGARQRRRSM